MDDGLGYAGDFASLGFGGISYADMNRGVTPVFGFETVPDPKSTEDGGCPRFTQIEVVRIFIAGDVLNNGLAQPVNDELRLRFSEAYARFKSGNQKAVNGTPLSEWPAMSPVLIKEFEALNINSVDDLAAVSDANISRHPDGRAWRARAAAFLEFAKDSAAAQKFASENERLRGEMDQLREDIVALRAAAPKPAAAPSGSPGSSVRRA